MRILFDHSTPAPLRRSFPSDTVITAQEQGWDRLSNGELLKAAEEAHFDVMLTADQNLTFQQSLAGYKLAVVVLSKNNWPLVQLKTSLIVAAVNGAKPGSYTLVDISDS
jgi:predicted nuclease of predicted toxin-antitoxin system